MSSPAEFQVIRGASERPLTPVFVCSLSTSFPIPPSFSTLSSSSSTCCSSSTHLIYKPQILCISLNTTRPLATSATPLPQQRSFKYSQPELLASSLFTRLPPLLVNHETRTLVNRDQRFRRRRSSNHKLLLQKGREGGKIHPTPRTSQRGRYLPNH